MGPETQFYLILPLLVLLILQIDSIKNFSKKTYAWLGLFIFGTVCRLSMIALWGNYQTPMFDSNFLNYIEFFFLGIFLSDARFEPNAWMRRRLTGSASQLTDLTLLALFAALSYWIWACEMGPLKSEPVPTLLNPPLLALIYGALILSARFGHGFISMTANWKPLSYLGKISFGVFLFHLMIQNSHLYNKIQNFLRVDTMPREFTFLINFLILLALSVVVAAILHKYYESPIIDWTHRRLKDRSSAVRKTKLDKTYDSV